MALTVIKDLFLNADDSDVTLRLFAEEEQVEFDVPGHRVVIRRTSSVLKKMVDTADFKEGKTKMIELKIKGNKCGAMAFIRYIYTKKLDRQDLNTYVGLMQTAHLYGVSSLLETVEKLIRLMVTPYSVCNVFVLLEKIASNELLNCLRDLILKSAFLIFESKLHLLLKEETMKVLLESDHLNVSNEEQAVEALWTWGQANCSFENKTSKGSIKNKVSKLLPLIRWKLVSDISEDDPFWCMIDEEDNNTGLKKGIADSKNDSIDSENDSTDSKNDCPRAIQNESLDRFCASLKFFSDLNDLRYEVLTTPTVSLVKVSVSSTVALMGIELQVHCRELTYQELVPGIKDLKRYTLDIDVDKRNVASVVFQFINATAKNAFARCLLVKFERPVIIRSTGIHTISVRTLHADLFGPAYERKSSCNELDTDSHFTIWDNVISVQKLNYFDL